MLSNQNYVWSQNHCSHGRKERTGCTEAALGRSSLHLCNLHSTQLLQHLPPSGKYGIAILERFDIPGEPVKSGGKWTWVCPCIHCSMLPFVSACVNLLCPHNIFNCTFTYVLRNCISSSSWLDICELQIHLHRCTLSSWWLQGVPWKQCTTRGVRGRGGRGSCHRPPSQQSGEGVLPFHNLPSVTLLLAVRVRAPAPPGRALEPAFWRH